MLIPAPAQMASRPSRASAARTTIAASTGVSRRIPVFIPRHPNLGRATLSELGSGVSNRRSTSPRRTSTYRSKGALAAVGDRFPRNFGPGSPSSDLDQWVAGAVCSPKWLMAC
jgi:hypothetical protein